MNTFPPAPAPRAVPNGAKPDITCYYNKTEFSIEDLSQSASWTNQIQTTTLYSDMKMKNVIGAKIQDATLQTAPVNGEDSLYNFYTGFILFNEFGSLSIMGGVVPMNSDPNVDQVYLDTIVSGKDDFLLAKGYIATVYPAEGDVVSVLVYLEK